MPDLPHSAEAEQYLLSSLLVGDAEATATALNAGITPESFFFGQHATIFAAISEVAARGGVADISSVFLALQKAGKLAEAGDFPVLSELAGLVSTTFRVGEYAARVRELAILRKAIRVTGDLHTEGFEAEADVGAYIERLERAVLGLANDRPKPARQWAQAVAEAEAEFQAMLKVQPGGVMTNEVSWGFSDFDRYFGAMQAGQLVILAARPSVGKSSLMRQTALTALRAGRPAFIASLEVKDRAIARNLAQTISGHSYRGFRQARHPRDVDEFLDALSAVRKLPLHVADNFSATVSQICAQARLLKTKAGIGLVCVDHLHELGECKNPPKGSNVAQAYGRAVKAFKELAGELEVPVLVLAQLNRGVEHDKRAPSLADLRDSGNIEEAADKVVFLHRPPENPVTGARQDETSSPREVPTFYVHAMQAKGRDDGTCAVGIQFQRACARFVQFDPRA